MWERSINLLPPICNHTGDRKHLDRRSYASRPGIKPATFQLPDDAPTNWATPPRARHFHSPICRGFPHVYNSHKKNHSYQGSLHLPQCQKAEAKWWMMMESAQALVDRSSSLTLESKQHLTCFIKALTSIALWSHCWEYVLRNETDRGKTSYRQEESISTFATISKHQSNWNTNLCSTTK